MGFWESSKIMIFINFKVYEQGTGASALALVKVLEEVATSTKVKIIPVVQVVDIKEAVESSKLEIWAQHVDLVEFGAHTGAILPEAVYEHGAVGTFLNHSERKFGSFEELSKAHRRAKEVGLKTLIFAANLDELERVIRLKSDFVSYEPPELVGSTSETVATAHPDVIEKSAKLAKEAGTPLIVGAGVHSIEDVSTSTKLGALGIAVATDVVKSDAPKKAILNLIEGFKQLPRYSVW